MRRNRAINRLWAVGLAIGLCLAASGCAPRWKHYRLVEQQVGTHDYQAADATIAQHENRYGDRNAVLYDLDRAMMLHLAGRYAESNAFLFKAEERIEALYTRSISTGVGAMLTNDLLLPYEGEDFEKVQINLIAALNYAYLGDLDEALVEARKVDLKLTAYNDRYATKNVYKEDAFARYLSGILYEARGEFNDALIAYRRALEAYEVYRQQYGTPMPPPLPADLLRLAEALGLRQEYQAYRSRFPQVQVEPLEVLQRQKGELIYVSYNGWAPLKQSQMVDLPVPGSKHRPIQIVRLALPRFVPRPSAIAYARLRAVSASHHHTAQTFPVQDINAIAHKDLEDRLARLTAKTLARAAAKYAAVRGLEAGTRRATGNDTAGALVGLLANIAAVATERADTRSWRTLPGEFQMARLSLPPGDYTVTAVYYARHGGIIEERRFSNVRLQAGQKIFLGYRLAR